MPAAPEPRGPAPLPAPLGDDEIDRLIGPAFAGYDAIVLAVSGGADSVALMHLADRWRRRTQMAPPRLLVATVDHGLRSGAAKEAAWVADRARALGLPHHTLPWHGAKPSTGIQQAARTARYELLAALAERTGAAHCALAVAHHQDDQAETLLMRLARGSGLDGLAAMAPSRAICKGSPVALIRPLLEIPKSRLIATLTSARIDWLEDPSNALHRFERVRLRHSAEALAACGLANSQLALSARRLRRAQDALQLAMLELEASAVDYHDGAYASLERRIFDAAHDEIQLRLLQRIIVRCGGGTAPSMARLEHLTDRLTAAGPDFAATLAGCHIAIAAGTIRLMREPGRRGLPEIVNPPGTQALWDGRFHVAAAADIAAPVTVRALPADAWREIKSLAGGRPTDPRFDIPRAAALTLPSFWIGTQLAAVPYFGFDGGHLEGQGQGASHHRFRATFI